MAAVKRHANNDFKLKAISHSGEHENRAAEREFNVKESMVEVEEAGSWPVQSKYEKSLQRKLVSLNAPYNLVHFMYENRPVH